MGLLVALSAGTLAYGIFASIAFSARADPLLENLLYRLPSLLFFTAFWLLLLSAITIGIQSFYLSAELPLLLSAPLRSGTVFAAKFVEATAANAALFLMLGVPMVAAYGWARGIISVEYVATSLLVLAAYAALPTSIGVLITMLLMRVLPAGRTRDALAALFIVLSATIYFLFISGSSKLAKSPEAIHASAERITATLQSPILGAGPWTWAASAIGGGDGRPGLGAMLLVLSALASIWICALVADALHVRGWSASAAADEGPRRRRQHKEAEAPLLQPGPFRAVYGKDFRTISRDFRQLSLLLFPIAAIGIFMADLRHQQGVTPPAVLLTMLFVLAAIALRLATAAFVAETRAFWLVLAAPCDPLRILVAKFAFAGTLSLAFSVAATVAFAHMTGLPPGLTAAGLGLVLCTVAGFTGIGVGACAVFADLKGETTRFGIPTAGRVLIFLGQVVFLAMIGGVGVAGWFLEHEGSVSRSVAHVAAGGLIAGISAVFTGGPLLVGANRLRAAEW